MNLHPKRLRLTVVERALDRFVKIPSPFPLPKGERVRGEGEHISIFLTSDAEISKLHRRFLGGSRPTDVMAFPGPPAIVAAPFRVRNSAQAKACGYHATRRGVGEIIISLDSAMRQARERKIPLKWELTLLALHGILHLRGFGDKKLRDWKKMRIAEFETMVKIL